MLFDLFKRFFTGGSPADGETRQASFDFANSYYQKGDVRVAVVKFREHLQRFPGDVEAINNLACCLVDMGDQDAAGKLFEQAFALDDSFLPAVINHAKHLVDKQKIDEALDYLRQAKAYEPAFPNVSAVYASKALTEGDADTARKYALEAWLAAFDNLRLANCFLFYCSYTDIDEARLAAEHRFWAETSFPRTFSAGNERDEALALPAKSNRVRVAYWSPDFRDHSVRYFIRPLLENHDRERFELVLYHDSPDYDEQTAAIRACCDHFLPVSEIPDDRLVELMRSHQIDILVELAGHSSANRLVLLRERLATVQLSGLGYPPTTGLATIDAKFLDIHIADAQSPDYYTEAPLVLGNSFWCFDPKEQPQITPEPPAARNGYLTFACVGNIAKITRPIMECWERILSRVPGSRLLIRSISLKDPAATRAIAISLEKSGIDLSRVDFHGPARGTEFFTSYNDVDIVLDTYPFNGGTTTCFATYMGVPVVSMAGKSLVSRMGKSILRNLGLSDWVVENYDDYVEKAVWHAQDTDFLRRFRSLARQLYASTPLGNGALFARDVEARYMELIGDGFLPQQHRVKALPAEELVDRAYKVLRHGQFDAARRIVDHCLAEHPECGAAHVLWTLRLTEQERFAEAADYLETRLGNFSGKDRFTALVNIARFCILGGRREKADAAIRRAGQCLPDDPMSRMQFRLLECYMGSQVDVRAEFGQLSGESLPIRTVTVLIVCDNDERFSLLQSRMERACLLEPGMRVRYRQCSEQGRWKSYSDALAEDDDEVLLIVQKNIEVFNERLFADLALALGQYDLVGIGGSRLWDRIDWRHGPRGEKASCFLIPSGEMKGFYEINLSGTHQSQLVDGMVVLDGSFLAIRKDSLRRYAVNLNRLFDPLLEGGGILQEEYLTHAAHAAGLKLAVHQNLGVVLDWRVPMANEHLGEARWQLAQRMSFDPFFEKDADWSVVSIPVESPEGGVDILSRFLEQNLPSSTLPQAPVREERLDKPIERNM